MDGMEGFEGHPGTNMLATVLVQRMKRENESPLALDFGEIQANGSLRTDTFPVPIPRGDYTVCRCLTLGGAGETLTEAAEGGSHSHRGGSHGGHEDGDGSHSHDGGLHTHAIPVPEKMRGLQPGDRVLVAWVQNEAVVVDIILRS